MDISMDIPMDIHEKICGYGCRYGWEISYSRSRGKPGQCSQFSELSQLDMMISSRGLHGALLCSVLQLDESPDSSVLLETIDYSRLLAPACSQFYRRLSFDCTECTLNSGSTVGYILQKFLKARIGPDVIATYVQCLN